MNFFKGGGGKGRRGGGGRGEGSKRRGGGSRGQRCEGHKHSCTEARTHRAGRGTWMVMVVVVVGRWGGEKHTTGLVCRSNEVKKKNAGVRAGTPC